MEKSINDLCILTGKSYRLVTKRLENLPFTPAAKGAKLYDVPTALEAIYTGGTKTLDQARTDLAIEQAEFQRVRTEELRKERIPIALLEGFLSHALACVRSTLAARVGKMMTVDTVNEALAELREVPMKIKPEHWSKKPAKF